MKAIMMLLGVFMLTQAVWAHDEGHGPKTSDTGKYGGLVSAVVLKKEANLGALAKLQYKAELVRSADGTVRLYLYNDKMKLLDVKDFDKKATGSLASKVKGVWKESFFALDLKDNVFIGKMPKAESKPYNIDVVLKDKNTELLTAFDNLD